MVRCVAHGSLSRSSWIADRQLDDSKFFFFATVVRAGRHFQFDGVAQLGRNERLLIASSKISRSIMELALQLGGCTGFCEHETTKWGLSTVWLDEANVLHQTIRKRGC